VIKVTDVSVERVASLQYPEDPTVNTTHRVTKGTMAAFYSARTWYNFCHSCLVLRVVKVLICQTSFYLWRYSSL